MEGAGKTVYFVVGSPLPELLSERLQRLEEELFKKISKYLFLLKFLKK